MDGKYKSHWSYEEGGKMEQLEDGASLFVYERVSDPTMIKSKGEAGNDAMLQKDRLLVMLICTALTTKNGLRSESLKPWS